MPRERVPLVEVGADDEQKIVGVRQPHGVGSGHPGKADVSETQAVCLLEHAFRGEGRHDW